MGIRQGLVSDDDQVLQELQARANGLMISPWLWWAIRVFTSAFSRIYLDSRAFSMMLTGTKTPPSLTTEKPGNDDSRLLGAKTATRYPLLTPSFCNPWAKDSVSSWSVP